jgi:hypothetical protein
VRRHCTVLNDMEKLDRARRLPPDARHEGWQAACERARGQRVTATRQTTPHRGPAAGGGMARPGVQHRIPPSWFTGPINEVGGTVALPDDQEIKLRDG